MQLVYPTVPADWEAWLWVKAIHWELCKILKCDHNYKWSPHEPESVQEKEIYKILYNFEIQTGDPKRQTKCLVLINKEKEN